MAEPVKFWEAPEVEKIANELIPKYHQHLIDFNVKIRYVFTSKTPKSGGKEVWGTCRKVSGLNAYLEGGSKEDGPFFVITISKDVWDLLPEEKKIILTDHELCHTAASIKQNKEDDDGFEQDNPIKLSVKPHDLEEFSDIVRRYGLWREDVQEFVEAALKSKENSTN